MNRLNQFLIILFSVSFLTSCVFRTNYETEHTTTKELNTIDEKIILTKLGDDTIRLNILKKGIKKIVYFNMHENENTAVKAAKKIVNQSEGILIEIKSKGERLISFHKDNKKYIFDPNRIFTETGIRNTLIKYGNYSDDAFQEVKLFAEFLLNYIITDELQILIAMHNNTNSNYSIKSYLKYGPNEYDANKVFMSPDKDEDDFFFVTEKKYYDYLKRKSFNVVLQNNQKVIDDGSLSVYCGQNGISYANVESQHGHLEEQIIMLETLLKYFNKK